MSGLARVNMKILVEGTGDRFNQIHQFLKFAKGLLATHPTLRYIATKERMGYGVLTRPTHYITHPAVPTVEVMHVTFVASEDHCVEEADGTLLDLDEVIRAWEKDGRFELTEE
ncbi:MAG: hypothetical protein Q9191_007348 [Dirinaria sp. TL-2023a]